MVQFCYQKHAVALAWRLYYEVNFPSHVYFCGKSLLVQSEGVNKLSLKENMKRKNED